MRLTTRTPVMITTVSIVAGIMLCDGLMPFIDIELWELLAVAVVWLIALYLLNKKETPKPFLMATILMAMTIGTLCYTYKYEVIRYGAKTASQHFGGVITDKPQRKAKTWAVTFRTDKGDRMMAYLAPDHEPQKGDSIELFCPYGAEPTCLKDNPDSTYSDYRDYLFHSGISATMYSPSGQWQVTGRHRPYGLIERLQALQSEMVGHYAESGFRGDEGAIIAAITTGDKSMLSKDLRQQYSLAGVAHVLALSGFHLTIICGLIELLIIGRLPRRQWKIWGRGITLVAIGAFTVMAGSPPSLVRAAIMCGIVIVSSMVRHENNPMNSLFLAILLMTIFKPMILFDVGFQLSVMSMLGLVTVGSFLKKAVPVQSWWLRQIWGIAYTTMASTLFTLPLISYYFGSVPLMSLFSNLVVPTLTIVMIGMAALWWILTPITAVQDLIGDVLTYTVRLMNQFTHWISSMDWAILTLRSTLVGVVLEYLLLGILLYLATLLYKRFNPIR